METLSKKSRSISRKSTLGRYGAISLSAHAETWKSREIFIHDGRPEAPHERGRSFTIEGSLVNLSWPLVPQDTVHTARRLQARSFDLCWWEEKGKGRGKEEAEGVKRIYESIKREAELGGFMRRLRCPCMVAELVIRT